MEEGSGDVGCLGLYWGLGEIGGCLVPSPAVHLEFDEKRAEKLGDIPCPGSASIGAQLNIPDGLVLCVV